MLLGSQSLLGSTAVFCNLTSSHLQMHILSHNDGSTFSSYTYTDLSDAYSNSVASWKFSKGFMWTLQVDIL